MMTLPNRLIKSVITAVNENKSVKSIKRIQFDDYLRTRRQVLC